DGLTPATPKATIQAVLLRYHPGYGDTIRVDAGTYNLTANIQIPAVDSGVTIVGYNDPAHPTAHAVLDRGNQTDGSDVFELTGGNDVTLDHLGMTDAALGVQANDTGSQRLTVSNDDIYGNRVGGINLFGYSVTGAVVTGNRVHDNNRTYGGGFGIVVTTGGGHTVTNNVVFYNASYGIWGVPGTNVPGYRISGNTTYGNGNGISAAGAGTLISGNTAYSNVGFGIGVSSGAVAAGNTTYGQNASSGSEGIELFGGEARDNTVFDNYNGIVGGGLDDGNRVFHNLHSGILATDGSTVTANQVYSNDHGIDSYNGLYIGSNQVYANSTYGIGVHGAGSPITNNTVYQPSGDALVIDAGSINVQVENNILWAVAGHDLTVSPDSENGFQSDYNDLVTANGNLLGKWEGRDFSNRVDWFTELGFDQHSITADPQFVNPLGADGTLGFSAAPVGPAQIVDDSSMGFSLSGSWTTQATGYAGGEHVSNGGNDDVATWTVNNLTPGTWYQVAVTWPSGGASSAAPFTVSDGSQLLTSLTLDQRATPTDFTDAGVGWKTLGTFYVTSGTLTVTVTHTPSYVDNVLADAVRVRAITGDGGGDDNFQVSNGSPTIDAGDPKSAYSNEPAPNGGRINLGYDGNSSTAAPSPIQFVQGVSPGGLEKYQVGQTVPIVWRSIGIYGPSGYYSSNVLGDNPVAYYRLADAAAAKTAADASGHGLGGVYQGNVTLGLQGALPSDSDTAAQFPGGSYDASAGYVQLPSGFANFQAGFTFEVWAFPTSVASFQPFFDFGNGYNSDNLVLAREGKTNNLIFQVDSGGSPGAVVRATGAIELNKWQHFAVTEDASGNVTLYKNGLAIATGATTVPRNVTRADNYLGKSNLFNPYYAGQLDDAAVFNQPLSAARILDHYNHAYFGTVNVDLLRDGDPTFLQHLADHALNNGSFGWTIPLNQPLANDYRIRIRANDGILPQTVTPEPFLVTNAGHDYYVNDGSTAGDVFTTAVGSNADSGKSPDQPVASLPALLAAYTFSSGDVIHVDTGTYNLIRNARLTPSDSGVTIVGPSTASALLNRGNVNSGAYDFELAGATDVTLDHLGITGGFVGVAANDSGSQRLTVSNSEIYGNTSAGIQLLGYSITDARIINNRIHDTTFGDGIYTQSGSNHTITGNVVYANHRYGISSEPGPYVPGNTITHNVAYGNNVGILAGGVGTIISDNTVHSNPAGIIVDSGALAVHNTVANSLSRGIELRGGTARANTVFDNYDGITGDGLVDSNRIFYNIDAGIINAGSDVAVGNIIYGNDQGIQSYNAANFASEGPNLRNNLIYENTHLGIGLHGGHNAYVTNNTVYQPTGDALQIDGYSVNNHIENNILWAQAGYDITVSADNSETNLQSDYNNLVTTGTGILGHWEDHDFTSRADWFYKLGLDQHSTTTDPQFIKPAGADGILGFSTATTGPAQIIDDSSSTGFSLSGSWVKQSGAGYNGEYEQSNGGNLDVATYTVSGLTPGTWNEISTTWPANNFASNTVYAVLDGGQLVSSFVVDQTHSPSDFSDAGVPWKTLGVFQTTSGTLTVTVTHAPSSYPNVIADALRVQAIQGDRGLGNNFHLQGTSPAIDAGDPLSPYSNEPAPNGGRVNQGFDGNTAGAAASAIQFVQNVSPAGLEKFQVGQAVPVTWRSVGIYGPAGSYAGAILADSPVAYYRLGDVPGMVAAVDASGHGLTGTYSAGVTLGLAGAMSSDPDTAAQFPSVPDYVPGSYVQLPTGFADFHNGFSFEVWAFPTSVDRNASFFDFGNGYGNNNNIRLAREGTTNNLTFQVWNGGTAGAMVRAVGAIELNVWQHFAVTEDALGNVTLYKNGQAVASGVTFVPQIITRTQNYLAQSHYGGQLDEAAVFNQALSATRILDHYNHAFFGTVNIDLVRDGDPTFVQHLADHVVNNGSFLWTIPATLPLAGDYRIRVQANDGTQPLAATVNTFLIANNWHDYYVNDGSTVGDVFTTAVGDDANSGKTPDAPMATLRAMLTAYTFQAGDVIHVDTGTYRLYRNIVVSAQDSGVTIQGPANSVALLDRNNKSLGTTVFTVNGATDVTLDHLSLQNATYGVWAPAGANSQRLTVSDNDIKLNLAAGVFIDASNNDAHVTGNRIHENGGLYFPTDAGIYVTAARAVVSGNEVFGNVNGILAVFRDAAADRITLSGNTVRDNARFGISASGDVLVTGNSVFGQSASGAAGIILYNNYNPTDILEVSHNVVHDNTVGIVTDSSGSGFAITLGANRVYHNSQVGMQVFGNVKVLGNQVYSNPVGIVGGSDFRGVIANNLVYANTNQAILLQTNNASQVDNNDLYQPVGDAVRIEGGSQNVKLYNNIIWVLAGYDLNVAGDSQAGLVSDYNLFNKGAAANAYVGFWNNATQNAFADWQSASGQDAHGLFADPAFVDINGADSVLGYTTAGSGYDGGPDDNFYLSAGSPAIDRGYSWPALATDSLGVGRKDDPGVVNAGGPDYAETQLASSLFVAGGTPQNFHASLSGSYFTLNLPFAFPFYDGSYTSVTVSSRGFLEFAGNVDASDGANSDAKLESSRMLAPFWANLRTDASGDDVSVDTSVANQITIRWQATSVTDGSIVNFAAILLKDGRIRFDYGAGNANQSPTIGISFGNGQIFLPSSYDGRSTLNNAASVEFDQRPGIVDIGAIEFRASSLQTTPPSVIAIAPAVVASGGSTGDPIHSLQVTLSEQVNPLDANSPAVYELRNAGANGFGSSDDVVYVLEPHYIPGSTSTTLVIDGLPAGELPVGNYRFTITSGTDTSIHDLAGLRLDGDGDGTPGGNYVRTFSIVPPQADLNVTESVDRSLAIEGELLHFTTTVDDVAGPQAADHVTLTALLPAGLTLVGANAPAGTSYDGASGVWSIANVAKGGAVSLVLSATVNANTVGQVITASAAIASSGEPDSNPNNNQASTSTTIVQSADLAVSQSLDDPRPIEGEVIHYTVTLTNQVGPAEAGATQVSIVLPTGVSFLSATPAAGTTFTSNNGLWTVPGLAVKAAATLVIAAQVNAATVTTTLTSAATISSEAQGDPNLANNISTLNTVVQPGADIAVSQTVNVAQAGAGQPVQFTLTVRNNGPQSADDVKVDDMLPDGVNVLSYRSTAGHFSMGGGEGDAAGTPQWYLLTLPAGDAATLVLTVAADSDKVGQTLTNTAALAHVDEIDKNAANNSSSASITVVARALSATGLSVTATEGRQFSGVVATFTDSDAQDLAGDFSATVNWGDGNTSTGSIGLGTDNIYTVSASHTYAEDGAKAAMITIAHDSSTTVTTTASLTVSDPAVVAVPATLTAVESAAGTFNVATFTDPAGAEAIGDYRATIDWGEGTPTSNASIALNAGIFTVSGTHTYAEEGAKSPVLTITHDSSAAVTTT
ncbi:MAG TPA: right-handed parallel beta-helix repeat-containing protein, partial [Pirellulales bacterium]|nr:right-handed parallel beta-helix repeat-containing protein [Pirellulales bacterium]